MKRGRLVYYPARISTIIEVTSAVLHIGDCPQGNLRRQWQCLWVFVGKQDKSIDCLRGALNIQRQSLIVVVSWRAIAQEERSFPELVSFKSGFEESIIARATFVMLQRIQYIPRMEVVNPMQISFHPIKPGPICTLMLHSIVHRTSCQLHIFFITSV